MIFAIEVPAEANPLTTENLHRVLTSASSTDQQQLKTSAQQLQNWEKQSGYYSALQSAFIDLSLPTEVRYLAIITLRSGIDKYWRKSAANAISAGEKALIRSRCLGFNEPVPRLALQNALVVSKIIRIDYPHEWPDVIQSIITALRSASTKSGSSLQLSRGLLILLHAVKVLITGRLVRTRTILQDVARMTLEPLGTIYIDKVNFWRTLGSGGNDESGALDSIEQSLLALRILRRLIVAGYDYPNRHVEVLGFWRIIGGQIGQMLTLVLQESSFINLGGKQLIEKHIIQMAKFHLNMVQSHPAGFSLLPDSTSLAHSYWKAITLFGETFGSQTVTASPKIGDHGDIDDEEMPVLEKVSLKGLLMLRACVKMAFNPAPTLRYQHKEDKEERKQSIELLKDTLLTESFVREVMETLVTRFFVFRARDLRDWEEEPEEWERREEGEGDVWEFSIRSCSEKLFLDLVIHYKHLLVQPLLDVFYKVATVHNTDVLLKDSIYAAIGLAAPVLERELDFGTFLTSTLVHEVQIQQPGYNILRRRIAITLGQWLPVKEGLDRPLVYQIFQHLLNKDDRFNDQVVRVTAGRQLKNVIDPFEFLAEPFMPYAPTILSSLMQLIEEVELWETKMALLNTISAIIEKMDHHISPLADQIVSLLHPLWAQAGDVYLIKQTILGILSGLVTSMKHESQRYHTMIIPLIESSVDPSSEIRVYLIEEAMDLWSAVLIQTPSPPSQEIISLTRHLIPMYESASEILRKAFEITELYIQLVPRYFFTEAPVLLRPLASLLATTKREAAGLITDLVELLIRTADHLDGSQGVANLTAHLMSSEFLSILLIGLRNAYEAHQTTGPNRPSTSIDGLVETDYLSVLARLALASPSLFLSALKATIPSESIEATISWLLTEWLSHLDNVCNPEKRKLFCLALTALLETNQPWILDRLQELMTLWTDLVAELVDEENRGADCLVWWNVDNLKPEGQETPADERRRNLTFADPIHKLDLKGFVRDMLKATVEACGGRESFERMWLVNVDAEVVRAFGALGVV